MYMWEKQYTMCGKSRFTIVSTRNSLFLIIYYYIIIYINNHKATFPHPE